MYIKLYDIEKVNKEFSVEFRKVYPKINDEKAKAGNKKCK